MKKSKIQIQRMTSPILRNVPKPRSKVFNLSNPPQVPYDEQKLKMRKKSPISYIIPHSYPLWGVLGRGRYEPILYAPNAGQNSEARSVKHPAACARMLTGTQGTLICQGQY